jgi:predicted RND superfamily exporter protein
MFTSLIKSYSQIVVRYRWAVLVIALIATGLLGAQISSLKLNNDPDIWAPRKHEFSETTRELTQVFGGRNVVIVGVYPKSGNVYTPKILQKIRNIQRGIEAMPQAIKHNVTSLAAKRVKDIAGSSEGMVVGEMLRDLPHTQQDIDKLKQAVARNPIYIDSLVTPDGKAAAIVADFRVSGEAATYAPLYEEVLKLIALEKDESVDFHLGGQPVNAANFEYAMQKMPIYFGVAFLIIMAVQYLTFRSLQGMLLPMATGILAVIWSLGILALAHINLDALNSTTPILIMAVATGHAVQILKRYEEELQALLSEGPIDLRLASRQAVAVSLQRVAPVMLTAGVIAALAFLSMTGSDVEMIRNFGIFAGCGILAAMVIELSLIPALRSMLPGRKRPIEKGPDALDRVLTYVGQQLTQPRTARVILLSSLMAIVGVATGALFVRSDNSFKQYFPADGLVRHDDLTLNTTFGGTDSIVFLIKGEQPDSMKDTRVLQAMAKLQDFLASQPHVGKTQSIADLIKRMNQAMHEDQPSHNVIPESSDLISQYLLLYSSSGDPQDFDSLVDNDYRRAVIWTYLKTDSTTYAKTLYEKCRELIEREFPPGITVSIGGSVPQTVASNDSLVDTKVQNIAQMAVAVFVLSSLALRSFVGGLFVVIPLAAIVLINLGMMGWMGIPLDMGTASITAMVTGIGGDYEIYMLYRLREEYRRHGDLNKALQASMLTSGKAVLFIALAIASGYAALLASDFQFYPRLGGTMMATMLVSAVLSLLFLRAVVVLIKPHFILGSKGPELNKAHLPDSQAPLFEVTQ